MENFNISNLQDSINELEKRISRVRAELKTQIGNIANACDCGAQLSAISAELSSVKASIADFDTRLKKVEETLSISTPSIEIE